MADEQWAGRRAVLVVGGITLLGLALRLPSFDDSLFGDEFATYFLLSGRDLGEVVDLVRGDLEATPPLFFGLAWATKGLGDTAESLRLVSLLAGVAMIPLTYLLGLWTVGRRAALVGSALVALSPFLILYSTDARPYALMLCFCLLSSVAMIRALDTGRTGWWIGYGIFSAAAMYTQYMAAFVLVAQFAWAFAARREARLPLIAANVAAAVAYIPWLPGFADDRGSIPLLRIEILRPFTLDAVITDTARWGTGHPDLSVNSLPGDLALWMLGAGLAAGILALALALRGADRVEWLWPLDRAVLVALLAIAAPVGAVIYGLFGSSLYIPRNLIASWPGLALLIGAIVTGGRGWLRVAALGLVLGGFAIGAARMLDADNQRPDFEAAGDYIERTGEAGDPVLDLTLPTGPGPPKGIEWALAPPGELKPERNPVVPGNGPTLEDRIDAVLRLGPAGRFTPFAKDPPAVAARKVVENARGGRFFVVSTESRSAEGDAPISRGTLLGGQLPSGFRLVEERTFPGYWPFDLNVYVYENTGSRAPIVDGDG